MITHWILKVTDGRSEGLGCGSLPELRTEESLEPSAKLQHSGRTGWRLPKRRFQSKSTAAPPPLRCVAMRGGAQPRTKGSGGEVRRQRRNDAKLASTYACMFPTSNDYLRNTITNRDATLAGKSSIHSIVQNPTPPASSLNLPASQKARPCANEHYSFVNISQNVMIVYVTLLAYLENRDELSVVQFLCYIRQVFELKCI